LNKKTDLKSVPTLQGERGESKEKKLQGEKTKLTHITGVSTYLP
jgi:hypothetical protein